MADLVASGAIDIPIAATYPLDRVADAFEQLEQRHTRGKIVLVTLRPGRQARVTMPRRSASGARTVVATCAAR